MKQALQLVVPTTIASRDSFTPMLVPPSTVSRPFPDTLIIASHRPLPSFPGRATSTACLRARTTPHEAVGKGKSTKENSSSIALLFLVAWASVVSGCTHRQPYQKKQPSTCSLYQKRGKTLGMPPWSRKKGEKTLFKYSSCLHSSPNSYLNHTHTHLRNY